MFIHNSQHLEGRADALLALIPIVKRVWPAAEKRRKAELKENAKRLWEEAKREQEKKQGAASGKQE